MSKFIYTKTKDLLQSQFVSLRERRSHQILKKTEELLTVSPTLVIFFFLCFCNSGGKRINDYLPMFYLTTKMAQHRVINVLVVWALYWSVNIFSHINPTLERLCKDRCSSIVNLHLVILPPCICITVKKNTVIIYQISWSI